MSKNYFLGHIAKTKLCAYTLTLDLPKETQL